MGEIGPIWARDVQGHRDVVLEIYSPLLARAPKAGVEITRDIAYGSRSRQRVDVYRPAGVSAAPVVMFVHGGAFIRGDKDINAEVYANVGHYFARHGCVLLNVEYGLAPEFGYPAGAEDLALCVDWARRNVASFGGDPARIVIIGHSAGGTHVASYAFDPALGADLTGVRGLVLVSARLRADVHADNPNAGAVRAYFGADESLYDVRSPVTHAARSQLPMLIAVAEYENPYLDVYGAELLHRVGAARGRTPRFLQLPGHNHISIIAHLNTEDDHFGSELRAFVAINT